MTISEMSLKEIQKLYGKEALYILSAQEPEYMDAISTGALLLDADIGIGGIPRGRITEIYGAESAGKTTLVQHIIANAQQAGITCAFLDIENAVDKDYAEACGVDFDTLLFSQPDFEEDALGIAEILVKDGNIGVVIVDSIAALTPKMEAEDTFEDKNVTGLLRAKLLKVFFRRAMPHIRRNNVAVIFTNQIIDNTKSMWGGTKPTGGRGIKHYASVRIALNKKYKGEIKSGTEFVGQDIEYSIVKNKVGVPLKSGAFTILFGAGISQAGDTLTAGLTLGVLNKRGSYITYNGEVLAQGRAKAIAYLKENTEITTTIRDECRAMLRS